MTLSSGVIEVFVSEVEYAARALHASDFTFVGPDQVCGMPENWDDLSENAQEDLRTRAEVFLKAYAKFGKEGDDTMDRLRAEDAERRRQRAERKAGR